MGCQRSSRADAGVIALLRNVLRLSTGLVALAYLFTTACGAPRDEYPGESVFRAALGSDPETFDPGVMSGSIEGQVAVQIYEGLLSPPAGNGPPEPGVAESWDVSDDGTVWTFRLRRDARWSNGDTVVAEDFREAWLRMLRGDVPADYVSFVRYIRHARAFEIARSAAAADPITRPFTRLLEHGVGVRAVDDFTLEVALESPTPFFEDIVMFYSMFPVHRPTVAEQGSEQAFLAENLVSNGPFRMEVYLRRNRIELVPNEHYWDRDNLWLDRVVFPIIEDGGARVTAFRDGRVDWAYDLPNDQLAILSTMPEFRSAPQLGTYFYRLNTTRPVLDDVRVRRALSLALNREELCRCTLDTLYEPAGGFVPPIPGWVPSDLVRYEPGEARRLLSEAGFPGGRGFPKLELLYNTSENHRTIAQYIQDQWKTELGIDITLLNQEWKVYLDSMDALDYEIARAGWIGDYVDPNTFLELWRTGDGNNRTGFASPRYDALIESSLREPDPERRAELLREAEELLLSEVPIIPVFYYSQFHLVRQNVHGWEMNVRNVHLARWIRVEHAEAP